MASLGTHCLAGGRRPAARLLQVAVGRRLLVVRKRRKLAGSGGLTLRQRKFPRTASGAQVMEIRLGFRRQHRWEAVACLASLGQPVGRRGLRQHLVSHIPQRRQQPRVGDRTVQQCAPVLRPHDLVEHLGHDHGEVGAGLDLGAEVSQAPCPLTHDVEHSRGGTFGWPRRRSTAARADGALHAARGVGHAAQAVRALPDIGCGTRPRRHPGAAAHGA